MSSENTQFYLFFLISIPFIFVSCFIALARTSSIILNSSGENKHPCLGPNLGGRDIQSFTIKYVTNSFLFFVFLCSLQRCSLQSFLCISNFVRIFIVNGLWILSDTFPQAIFFLLFTLDNFYYFISNFTYSFLCLFHSDIEPIYLFLHIFHLFLLYNLYWHCVWGGLLLPSRNESSGSQLALLRHHPGKGFDSLQLPREDV